MQFILYMVIKRGQFKQQNKAKFYCKYVIPRGADLKVFVTVSPIVLKVRGFKL